MPTRAVLFDFDGVIADTENIHIAAWQRVFGMMGWEAPDELCAMSMEKDDRLFLDSVFEMKKFLEGDIDGWVAKKQKITLEMLTNSPRIYPGIPELITQARRRRFKIAVVTTTWRENVTTVLQASGLLKKVDVIVGKEDVVKTKPDPEPYLRALTLLAVPSISSLAFEDSPTGLAAAHAALVPAIAVGHRRPKGPWVGHVAYVPDLRNTEYMMELLALV